MTESRVNQVGAFLDAKNSVVRTEAARAFGKFSICDQTAVDVSIWVKQRIRVISRCFSNT